MLTTEYHVNQASDEEIMLEYRLILAGRSNLSRKFRDLITERAKIILDNFIDIEKIDDTDLGPRKTVRKLIVTFFFQVGVNVIGLPDIRKNEVFETTIVKMM